MKNYFEFVDTNREQFMALLKSNEFKCNAAGRRFMAERVKVSKPRPVTTDMDTLRYAEEIGGLKPGNCGRKSSPECAGRNFQSGRMLIV